MREGLVVVKEMDKKKLDQEILEAIDFFTQSFSGGVEMKKLQVVAVAISSFLGINAFAGTFLFDDEYSSDISFNQPPLTGTSTSITYDGSNYWSTTGGGTFGTRSAQYDSSGNPIATYSPGLDFRSVFTDASGSVYARQHNDSTIYKQTSPGVFCDFSTLNGGSLNSQTTIIKNTNGEFVGMYDGVVSLWDSSGNYTSSFSLAGYPIAAKAEKRGIALC